MKKNYFFLLLIGLMGFAAKSAAQCQGFTASASGTNITCHGDNNGTIQISASGGSAPYAYALNSSSFQQTPVFFSLTAGIYTVRVEDINGCTATTSVIISEPNPLAVSFTPAQSSICSGMPICATASGGTTLPTFSARTDTVCLSDNINIPFVNIIPVSGLLNQSVTETCGLSAALMNFQHSFAGDLEIEIICPNGQIAKLKNYLGNNGGGNFFGLANDQMNICYEPSAGLQYGWSSNPVLGLPYHNYTLQQIFGATPVPTNPSLPLGICNIANPYNPGNPTPATVCPGTYFPNDAISGAGSPLIGCPMNGDWTIKVTDHLGADNGKIFSWGLVFDACTATPPVASASYNFSWDTGDHAIDITSCITVNQARTYNVTVTDAVGCTGNFSHDVLNNYNPCVFPGDADNDGVANNFDLLPIGLSNAMQGNARLNATINWQPETCQNWIDSIPNSTTNRKHVDCDGNGTINANDSLVILHNYGQVHQRGMAPTLTINDPPISCVFASDTIQNTNFPYTLTANVVAGSVQIPANNVHGLAFTINYDPAIATNAYFNLQNVSWLGAPNELFHLQHDDGQGHLDVAITRFDGQTRSGEGVIGQADFVIIDNIIGRGESVAMPFNVSVSNIKAITAQNIEVPMNGLATQIVFADMVLGTNNNLLAQNIRISPNPTHAILNIQTNNIAINNLTLTNVLGQILISQKTFDTNKNTTISLENFPQGSYFLIIDTPEGKLTQKIMKL